MMHEAAVQDRILVTLDKDFGELAILTRNLNPNRTRNRKISGKSDYDYDNACPPVRTWCEPRPGSCSSRWPGIPITEVRQLRETEK